MKETKGCEYAEWIDNDYICEITGSLCQYSIPNSYECLSIYEKYKTQLKRSKKNDQSDS